MIHVTGGAGFIGANFVRYWLDEHPGDALVVLDALTYAGNQASLAGLDQRPNYSLHPRRHRRRGAECRISCPASRRHVVHFAAESHVDRSIVGPPSSCDQRPRHLRAAQMPRGVPGTTGSGRQRGASGSSMSRPTRCTARSARRPPSPRRRRTPRTRRTQRSKAAADHLVRAYHHTYGMPDADHQLLNNYGPYQFPEKLIPLMIMNALEGKPLPVYGDGTECPRLALRRRPLRGDLGGAAARAARERSTTSAATTSDEPRGRQRGLRHLDELRPKPERSLCGRRSRSLRTARATTGATPSTPAKIDANSAGSRASHLQAGIRKTVRGTWASSSGSPTFGVARYRDWIDRQYGDVSRQPEP